MLECIDLCDKPTEECLNVIGAGVADDHENALRWRAREVGDGFEVAILGDKGVAMGPRPFPDGVVSARIEELCHHMGRAWKLIGQTPDERAGQILIEQKSQTVAARSRICSAA